MAAAAEVDHDDADDGAAEDAFEMRRHDPRLGLLRTLRDGIAVPTSLDHLSETEQRASMQKLRSSVGREDFGMAAGTDGRTGEDAGIAAASERRSKLGGKPSMLTRMMTMTSASTKKSKVGLWPQVSL